MLIEWTSFDKEVKTGWYAIHYGWDSDEGSFVGVDFFTETGFQNNHPIIHISSDCFNSKEEAEIWSQKNDFIAW